MRWTLPIRKSLKRFSGLTNESQFVDKVLRNWLKNTTAEQRQNFINIIYDVIITVEDTFVKTVI